MPTEPTTTTMEQTANLPIDDADWARHFAYMYAALDALGWADSYGGAESERVMSEAIAAGRPVGAALSLFIHRAANPLNYTEGS